METLLNWITSNGLMLIAIAGMMCGIALFYLVMIRTVRQGDDTSDTGNHNP